MRRFFCSPSSINNRQALLGKEESNHIRTVLRLKAGSLIELFDGSGLVYTAEILALGHRIKVKIIGQDRPKSLKISSLWLGQANLKGKKIDELIPSCNELGVDVFALLESSRCQGRLDKARLLKKQERWRRLVEASCKQCGRTGGMEIASAQGFKQAIRSMGPPDASELRIIFWEEETDLTLHDLDFSQKYKIIRMITGPEGGFTAEEIELAKSYGWQSVSLGKQVLKAVNAAVTATALVQFLGGNLGRL